MVSCSQLTSIIFLSTIINISAVAPPTEGPFQGGSLSGREMEGIPGNSDIGIDWLSLKVGEIYERIDGMKNDLSKNAEEIGSLKKGIEKNAEDIEYLKNQISANKEWMRTELSRSIDGMMKELYSREENLQTKVNTEIMVLNHTQKAIEKQIENMNMTMNNIKDKIQFFSWRVVWIIFCLRVLLS